MASDFFVTNCINIVCFVYILIILIMFFLKGRTHRIPGKVFFALLACTMLCIMMFTIWSFLATSLSDNAILFGKILCFVLVCWDYLLVFYMAIVFKSDEENEKFYREHNIISYVLGGILVLINILCSVFLEFKITRLNDGHLFILDGPLKYFMIVMGGITLLYSVGSIIVYRKKVDFNTRALGLLSVVICLISILTGVSGIMPINDVCFLYTVVIMFLYFSIESQDSSLLEEFYNSNKKSEELNHAKSEFITNMSHQLRAPMNTILGFTDMLLSSDSFVQSEYDEGINDIEEASKKLYELVSSILDISKLDSKKEMLNNQDYKLESIIFDISSNVNGLIDKEGLMFFINVDENIHNCLNGDDYKIDKILNILLAYSVKHSNRGKISLDVTSCLKNDDVYEYVFHIKNNARFLNDDFFNKNFEELLSFIFNSKNGIDVDIIKIIIVKGLLDLLNGSIEFVSSSNGEEFIIKIEQKVLNDEKIGNIISKIQTRNSVVLDISDKKCLIVDDTGINTIVLNRMLKQYNLNVENIISPLDAISKVSYTTYDFIFVNHDMMEMSGVDFVKKISESGIKVPPVIALTSVSDTFGEENVYVDHIMCPIESRLLRNVLNKVLDGEKR